MLLTAPAVDPTAAKNINIPIMPAINNEVSSISNSSISTLSISFNFISVILSTDFS